MEDVFDALLEVGGGGEGFGVDGHEGGFFLG